MARIISKSIPRPLFLTISREPNRRTRTALLVDVVNFVRMRLPVRVRTQTGPLGLWYLLFFLYALGCGQDTLLVNSPTAQPKIKFYLAPSASTQYNITEIKLTVQGPDIEQTYSITNIDREKRTAGDFITVPIGSDITFFAEAFEEICPVLSGSSEPVEVTHDTTKIEIKLTPIQVVIGIQPKQDRLNVGSTFSLEVYVKNAPKLFAFTCELEFDENLLEPIGVIPGDFFGEKDDVLFLEDSQLPRRQENRLSLGITRKAGAAGICGSGAVFRITFSTIGTGNAMIKLLRNDMLALTTPAFKQIKDFRIEASYSVKIE